MMGDKLLKELEGENGNQVGELGEGSNFHKKIVGNLTYISISYFYF